MKRWLTILGILAAVLPANAQMDQMLSGRRASEFHESVFDSKRKLYLFSAGDCDGAHRRLVLCADLRSIFWNEGYEPKDLDSKWGTDSWRNFQQEFKPGKITPRTGRGIQLGMAEEQVQKILGRPTQSLWSKKFQARELVYAHETPLDKDGIGARHANYYLFRNGKLFYIELARDVIGGG